MRRLNNRQPQRLAAIDWSNPITRGLLFAALPDNPVNIVDGVGLTPKGNPVTVVRRAGKAISGGSYAYPAPALPSDPATKLDITTLTALVIAQQDTKENNSQAFLRGNGSSTPLWAIGLHGGSFNGAYAIVGSFSYSPVADVMSATATSRCVVLTADGSMARVYEDGQLQAGPTAYTPTTPQYDTANLRQVLFGNLSGQGVATQTKSSLGLLWNRPLSVAEVLSISQNSWQVFRADAAAAPLSVLVAGVVNTTQRAVILSAGGMMQITDALVGTSKRPLVLVNGQVQERVAGEGTPIILDKGNLRTLAANETLII